MCNCVLCVRVNAVISVVFCAVKVKVVFVSREK